MQIAQSFNSSYELSQHLSIPEFEAESLRLVVAGLQTMLPFTRSCFNAAISPKRASEIILLNPELLNYIQSRQRLSYNLFLNVAGEAAKAKDGKALIAAVADIKAYSPQITLWESYCKRSDVTQGKVLEAMQLHRDNEDVATSLGMEPQELVTYVSKNPGLSHILGLKEKK